MTAKTTDVHSPEYAELRRLARIGARCELIATKARPPIMEFNMIWATAYNKALDDCLNVAKDPT